MFQIEAITSTQVRYKQAPNKGGKSGKRMGEMGESSLRGSAARLDCPRDCVSQND